MGIPAVKSSTLAERRTNPWACAALLLITFAFVCSAHAADQVSLQLKWKHQFQFAGYYAAIEKGFYRASGLEVDLREGGPNIDAGAAVAAGDADFGVCTASVLVKPAERANNVILGVIFQHSAAAILTLHRSGIRSVAELKGHSLMDAPDSDDIAAMLKHEGVDYASLPRATTDGNLRNLLKGAADAMIAYTTNEPFVFEKLGTPYLTFSPRAFAANPEPSSLLAPDYSGSAFCFGSG